jgi:Na+/proline symporter
VVAQELVARVIACRSPRVARRCSILGAALYLAVGLIPVSLGLAGARLIPGLEHGEQILPLLAQRHLSPILYILFAGALVSAILSTVDSALLAASSLVSNNLIFHARPGMTEAASVRVARGGVVVFGLIAYVLALKSESVYHLVEAASATGSAGIFVILIFGLFTRFGGRRSALAALAGGLSMYLYAGWLHAELFSAVQDPISVGGALSEGLAEFPFLASLSAALLAYLAVAIFECKRVDASVSAL